MEEYKLVDGKRIKAITSVGISYLDNEGTEQFIDFAECYTNYVRKITSPDYWERIKQLNNFTDADWERHVQRMKNWKEIGARQPLTPPWADGPYIEFHTDPPIRFKFDTQEAYGNVINAIIQTDWKTFDQS